MSANKESHIISKLITPFPDSLYLTPVCCFIPRRVFSTPSKRSSETFFLIKLSNIPRYNTVHWYPTQKLKVKGAHFLSWYPWPVQSTVQPNETLPFGKNLIHSAWVWKINSDPQVTPGNDILGTTPASPSFVLLCSF